MRSVQHVFHHVVKTWQLFLRPAACLTSTLLETEVGADCKCSRDQQVNVSSEAGGARDNKFWLPIL
jgi:hypothetical protein